MTALLFSFFFSASGAFGGDVLVSGVLAGAAGVAGAAEVAGIAGVAGVAMAGVAGLATAGGVATGATYGTVVATPVVDESLLATWTRF